MYWHDMHGLDWLWGTLMMAVWVGLIGVVVYLAVYLGRTRDRKR